MLRQVLAAVAHVDRKVDLVIADVRSLASLISKGFATAMTDLATVITQLDTVTNNLAADVKAEADRNASLQAQLAALKAAGAPPTQEQIDAIGGSVTRLNLMEQTLRSLGADPANPVPTPAPIVQPVATTDATTAPVTTPTDPATPTS